MKPGSALPDKPSVCKAQTRYKKACAEKGSIVFDAVSKYKRSYVNIGLTVYLKKVTD